MTKIKVNEISSMKIHRSTVKKLLEEKLKHDDKSIEDVILRLLDYYKTMQMKVI